MINHVPLLAGVLVGLSIAVPIGPMGLLCIQRTLSSGMGVGVSTGLGAATVNLTYGTVILFGVDWLAPFLATGGRVLNALGGLFLLWTAARIWLRGPTPAAQPAAAPLTKRAAYGSAVAFNAANPMSLILIMALLTPIAASPAGAPGGDAMILLGLFAGAMLWWVCLSFGVAMLRTRLSPAILAGVDKAAGLILSCYGALALARSVHM